MNALVSSESAVRLSAEGFRVYRHILVPPNDGGISLGQLAIGAAALAKGTVTSLPQASELHTAVAVAGPRPDQSSPRIARTTRSEIGLNSAAHRPWIAPHARQEG
jgi:hypothetical protein